MDCRDPPKVLGNYRLSVIVWRYPVSTIIVETNDIFSHHFSHPSTDRILAPIIYQKGSILEINGLFGISLKFWVIAGKLSSSGEAEFRTLIAAKNAVFSAPLKPDFTRNFANH